MLVEQVWVANSYRNFNYLVACPETGEALAIDPLDFRQCLSVAESRGWEITQVLNTHEHPDHIGGNKAVINATGAKLLAHKDAGAKIKDMDVGLSAGDVVRVGRSVELECLDTPGHTMCHLCLLAHGDAPALFSGDTLFNAGAGNCHNGGDPDVLFDTFDTQLSRLDDDIRLFPGHEYLGGNLGFTLDREPDNAAARALIDAANEQTDAPDMILTLGQEREINTFLRLEQPEVIARLRESFPDLPAKPSPRQVFLKLRELRNHW
ncbi:MAG: hydroxyacylglutathione hydrolase [Pseudomonadota bacterium]